MNPTFFSNEVKTKQMSDRVLSEEDDGDQHINIKQNKTTILFYEAL